MRMMPWKRRVTLGLLAWAVALPFSSRAASTIVHATADDFRRGERSDVEIRSGQGGWLGLAHAAGDKAAYVAGGSYTSPVLDGGPEVQWRTIRWTELWTTPQHFRRHAGNPVLDPSRTGAWDNWTNGVSILRFGDTYRMFFASGPAGSPATGGIGWADACTSQPTVWRVNPQNPVLRLGPAGSFEEHCFSQPRVIKLTDAHWRMYYTGWDKQGHWKLGLADSHDGGATWEKYPGNPILPAGPGEYDSLAACVPHVLKDGELFKMWYTARGPGGISLAYATSRDGIHWEKYEHNPVLNLAPNTPHENKVVSRCYVLKEGGVYKMWYSMMGDHYRIGYAESLDGIHWERSPLNPILDRSEGNGFDSQQVEYPEIQRHDDGTYRLWFCGNGFGSVGYAESQPSPWKVILRTRSGPTPRPDKTWSAWSAPCRQPEGSPILSPTGRYLQYRVEFQTGGEAPDNRLSPELARVEIEHEPDPTAAIKVPRYHFRGTHYEIGRQFGQAERERIVCFFEMYGGKIKVAALAQNPQPLKNLKQLSPDLYEEIRGIGDGAGLSTEQIAALIYCDEPLCSGIALTETELGPMVGKTTDGSQVQGVNYALVLREPTDGGYRTISMGHTGTITAETVMNDQGLCLGCRG